MNASLKHACDLSYGILTPAWFASNNISLIIQNLWTGAEQPPPRVTNLRLAHEADRMIAGYIALRSGGDGLSDIDAARAGVPDDLWAALAFVALDLELPAIPDQAIRRALIGLAAAGHSERVIYTRRGYWEQAGLVPVPHSWLWNADPGNGAFVAYGGWDSSTLLATQITGTVMVGDLEVDLDLYDPALLAGLKGNGMATVDTVQTLAARQDLAGAALRNDMQELVRLLVYFGVLPAGIVANMAALSG